MQVYGYVADVDVRGGITATVLEGNDVGHGMLSSHRPAIQLSSDLRQHVDIARLNVCFHVAPGVQ